MTHTNAPLLVEGRRRLVERCKTRPIAHVAAELGISRACASKWVNRWRRSRRRWLRRPILDAAHEPEGVAATIRRRRLERCRADLARPDLRQQLIQTIAARWGFTSTTAFSRTFRTAYDITPRDYRADALKHADETRGAVPN